MSPWKGSVVAAGIDGTYRDTWGKSGESFSIKQEGAKFVVSPGDKSWSDKGTLDAGGLQLWGLTGTVGKDGTIAWSNGSAWEVIALDVPAAKAEKEAEKEAEVDVSGSWRDPWSNSITVLAQQGTKLTASSADGGWSEEGTIRGTAIELFQLKAWLRDGKIAWENENEWARAEEAAAESLSGTWEDGWSPGSLYKLTQSGKELTVAAPDGSWPASQGSVEGTTISVWGLTGEWKGAEITWSSGSFWRRAGSAAAEAAEAADLPASAWDMFNGGEKKDGALDPVSEAQRQRRWQEFSGWQEHYKAGGVLPGKSEEELLEDDGKLFEKDERSNEGIDFDLYDTVTCTITGTKSENIPELTTFSALFEQFNEHLPKVLVENIQRCGFNRPTPVQKFSIPAALSGRDIMCCAQTGSGKTAAFLIPILASMIKHSKATGALQEAFEGHCKPDTVVLSPTRELCLQIYDHATKFCHRTPHRCVRVYGQEGIKVQMEQLAKGGDLCIATPGRMWDFVTSGIISVEDTGCLVLDEADRMMDMSMEPFIREIVEKNGMPSNQNRQTLMFSATFPESCQKMAQDYLYDHLFIAVGSVGGAVCTVKQTLMKVAYDQKFEALMEFLDQWLNSRNEKDRLLLFTNSKINAKGLDEKLYERNIDTGALHGDLTQPERETNLGRFRSGEIDVLVATDLASRGLDIRGVSHVVNYDLPREPEVYVQRIGRTGRIGNRGEAVSFVAVDSEGKPYDNTEMLKALPSIMQDESASCRNEIPAWFQEITEELQSGSWGTSGKKWWEENKEDVRKWDEGEQQASPGEKWW